MQDEFDARPFRALLAQQGLPAHLQDTILHAIAMVDADQSPAGASNTEVADERQDVSAAQGLEAMRTYMASLSRCPRLHKWNLVEVCSDAWL